MATKFYTGLAKGEDSFKVGQEAAQKAMAKSGDKKVDLSVVFASSKYDYPEVIKGIRKITRGAPLIGCSSAGEFTEERTEKESVACAVISSDAHKFFIGMGKGLKENQIEAVKQASRNFPQKVGGYPYLSAMMYIDGLSGKGEESVLSGLTVLGPTVKFSGGAAGDDLKFKETKVFVNEQVSANALSLCLMASKIPVAIGVKHGHSPISPPLTITKAVNNVLYEVDGKPAFTVWKEYIREQAKKDGIDVDKLKDASEIGSFLLRYEAGLLTGEDYKVRVPLSVNPDGSLNFACTIVEGSVIRIMQSRTKEAQICSAKEAAEIVFKAAKGAKLAGAIVFDCVCRAIILGDEFYKGVQAIKNVIGGDIPLIGFETYGEIAMEMGQMSGFHNTTTVILLIPA